MAADKDEEAVEAVFKALADPTRRQILKLLRNGEVPAGEIAGSFPISGPSVSRHLALLKSAGLIGERRQANRILYSLEPSRLTSAVAPWLLSVCPEVLALVGGKRKKKEKASQKAPAKEKRRGSGSPVQLKGASGGHSRPETDKALPVTQANN
ncbi:MAG TPA: metalloregulator ArsR/SmtB family transcription factor [Acidimicrobiales bacterium]|nr:metalloregulator ArsR/SmtB family transcription factor [Acidimicrobiales bacterium]